MGEIADLMIEGEICEGCGCELDGEAPGYPRRCAGCGGLVSEGHDLAFHDKREARRSSAQEELKKAGISFYTNNDGVHLICSHGKNRADFWPGRDKFRMRPPHPASNKTQFGSKQLIKLLKGETGKCK
jgi:hypothetical protein